MFWYREGDFVTPKRAGGRFCPWRAILHTPTSPFRHNANSSTLPQHFHPPKTNTPSRASRNTGYTLPQAPPEGDLVSGGCFCPGRAILRALTSSSRYNADSSTLPRHFHPPKTNTPSRVNCWTVSSRSCAALKRREYGALEKWQ